MPLSLVRNPVCLRIDFHLHVNGVWFWTDRDESYLMKKLKVFSYFRSYVPLFVPSWMFVMLLMASKLWVSDAIKINWEAMSGALLLLDKMSLKGCVTFLQLDLRRIESVRVIIDDILFDKMPKDYCYLDGCAYFIVSLEDSLQILQTILIIVKQT